MRRLSLIAALALPVLAAACGDDEIIADQPTGMPDSETDTVETAPAPANMAVNDSDEPAPQPASTAGDMLAGAADDGQWFYKEDGPAALFGDPATDAAFGFRCDSDRREIVIQRAVATEGALTDLALYTGEDSRKYNATPTDGPMPLVEARLDVQDMFLDRIAMAERIAVVTGNNDRLVMELDGTVDQLIEACRSRFAYTEPFTLGLPEIG